MGEKRANKQAIARFSEEQFEQVREMQRDSEALRAWRSNPLQNYGKLAERGIDPRQGVDYAAHWRRIEAMQSQRRLA